ncbi:MAG: hypothetical protein AAFX58_08045 [Pseudomonadota bacterium]
MTRFRYLGIAAIALALLLSQLMLAGHAHDDGSHPGAEYGECLSCQAASPGGAAADHGPFVVPAAPVAAAVTASETAPPSHRAAPAAARAPPLPSA